MGHGTELRVPFLDLALVELAMRLPRRSQDPRHGQEKWILRHAFADVAARLHPERPKDMMSYSSGLHERARLFKPLFPRMHRSFGYDLLEPVRRDFDRAAERTTTTWTGHRSGGRASGLPAAEHARDLAGALRWNAAAALRARRHPAAAPR